jgi:hypothetical protein
MDRRLTLMTVLAAAHLFQVVCGACSLSPLPKMSTSGQALRYYGVLSGSDNGYGFFSPNVASTYRARFAIAGDGRARPVELGEPVNNEVGLRAATPLILFNIAELHDPMAASWAGMIFGRHPDARQVTVRVEEYDIPTLRNYRAGERPRWQPVYEAAFARRDSSREGD